MRYTYSRWDDSQTSMGFDPDDVMQTLSDEMLSDGDLTTALQRVMRWGLQAKGQQHAPGLEWVLRRLRAQRQQELERYKLDSMMDDIREQVTDVIRLERAGIDRRLSSASPHDEAQLREILRDVAQRKQAQLEKIPEEPGPAIAALADYEFLDDDARAKFTDLLDMLQDRVLTAHFRTMQQAVKSLGGENLGALKSMLGGLNDLLEDQGRGDDSDFARFMSSHGRFFPGAKSLQELVEHLQAHSAHMESLVQSLSPEMRGVLERLVNSVLDDADVREELARLAENMHMVAPARNPPADYPFTGSTSLTLEEALRLMKRMHDLDKLEEEVKRSLETGVVSSFDGEQVEELLGQEVRAAVEHVQGLTALLKDAGYVEEKAGALELTARGVRKIGQKALQDIFQHLKRDAFGRHEIAVQGAAGERTDSSKPYAFGDPFLLDLQETLMNAALRQGGGVPLRLATQDFSVYRTEYLTRSSTVLLLDMSRSMPLRGCFVAAKKVAFALHSLIRTRFPRDYLYIVGFSDYARVLRPESLYQITWGDYVYGTNIQHGLMVARRLLGRHNAANKQIILITDGEPTAHFEGDRVQFSYPPTFRTFQETLREVKRCTQEGIVINTFMLERSHYLADFVNQMTRINRGRAFFSTPDRLGDYILVDYVSSKKAVGTTTVSSA